MLTIGAGDVERAGPARAGESCRGDDAEEERRRSPGTRRSEPAAPARWFAQPETASTSSSSCSRGRASASVPVAVHRSRLEPPRRRRGLRRPRAPARRRRSPRSRSTATRMTAGGGALPRRLPPPRARSRARRARVRLRDPGNGRRRRLDERGRLPAASSPGSSSARSSRRGRRGLARRRRSSACATGTPTCGTARSSPRPSSRCAAARGRRSATTVAEMLAQAQGRAAHEQADVRQRLQEPRARPERRPGCSRRAACAAIGSAAPRSRRSTRTSSRTPAARRRADVARADRRGAPPCPGAVRGRPRARGPAPRSDRDPAARRLRARRSAGRTRVARLDSAAARPGCPGRRDGREGESPAVTSDGALVTGTGVPRSARPDAETSEREAGPAARRRGGGAPADRGRVRRGQGDIGVRCPPAGGHRRRSGRRSGPGAAGARRRSRAGASSRWIPQPSRMRSRSSRRSRTRASTGTSRDTCASRCVSSGASRSSVRARRRGSSRPPAGFSRSSRRAT